MLINKSAYCAQRYCKSIIDEEKKLRIPLEEFNIPVWIPRHPEELLMNHLEAYRVKYTGHIKPGYYGNVYRNNFMLHCISSLAIIM